MALNGRHPNVRAVIDDAPLDDDITEAVANINQLLSEAEKPLIMPVAALPWLKLLIVLEPLLSVRHYLW